MPRNLRVHAPGYPQHLCVRGAAQAPTFRSDKDRHVYLRYLREEAEEWHCHIHAYALMTNHVHLLATGQRERAVARFMQVLNRRFTVYFNKEHDRVGTLYQGRYYASVVDTERYFFKVMQYIELNPVVAGLVTGPAAYRWSSYRENASGDPGGLLTPHATYLEMGPSPEARGAAYQKIFDLGLDNAARKVIREGLRQGKLTGRAVSDTGV